MESVKYLIYLEPPQGLKPKELFELGYMWAPEEDISSEIMVTGPENYLE